MEVRNKTVFVRVIDVDNRRLKIAARARNVIQGRARVKL